MSRVCVIIPAYNEAAVISDVIRDTIHELKKTTYDYEVVVVDDGSSDQTEINAKKAGATVIRHILNSGAGGATSTGLRYAQTEGFEIAATMDADGQHLPSDLIKGFDMMSKREETDLLIGSRLIDSGDMTSIKRIGNKGLSLITFILFGINSTDSQSGLRLFSRRAIDQLEWRSSGYEFCSEMLWRASQLGLVIDEYPIRAVYTDYSKSKGQSNWNAVNIIKSLLRRRITEMFE